MTLEEQVAGLLAREEIRDLVTARYASVVDWLDIAAMKECFTEDSEAHFGDISMGGQAFCDMWSEMGAGAEMRFHFVDCARITVDGDTAKAETRAITAGTKKDGEDAPHDYLHGLRYFFDLERGPKGWQIAKMNITSDWSLDQPTPPAMYTGAAFDRGLDTTHWLYRHMKGLEG